MNITVAFKTAEDWHSYNLMKKKHFTGSVKQVALKLSKNEILFTLQTSDFIREFDKVHPIKKLPLLVDIESFVKQFYQKSKPLLTQTKWNFFHFLKENDFIPRAFKIQEQLPKYLEIIAGFISSTLNASDLKEIKRFQSIEIPINSMIYKQQRKGVGVDLSNYPDLMKELELEIYGYKNSLQLDYNIFTPSEIATQIDVLKSEGAEYGSSILSKFKSQKESSELCRLFYNLIRAERDLQAIVFMSSSKGGISRTFPEYHGFGSISSRITLREPALQNLRRKFRVILKPDVNCEFVYIDYSQFEAGILASLSGDSALQKLYDSDIYDDINKKVWLGKRTRGEAKELFYKFIYGVEFKEGLEHRYFASFTDLLKFKKAVELKVTNSGKVGSSFGNFRILDEEEIGKALSHRIQSEASLIFKESLLKVNAEVPEAEFILPMHDAALYQINVRKHNKDLLKSKIIEVFKTVFALRCEGIGHSVNEKDFFND